MGERLLCKQEVIGSIPFTSTTLRPAGFGWLTPPGNASWAKECPPKPWRRWTLEEPTEHTALADQGLRRAAIPRGLFDIVKKIVSGLRTSIECGISRVECWPHVSLQPLCVGLVPACDKRVVRRACPCARQQRSSAEGHLVDALAPRGDEGRSTLR